MVMKNNNTLSIVLAAVLVALLVWMVYRSRTEASRFGEKERTAEDVLYK
jgi:membrane protein involved in colicin uptake